MEGEELGIDLPTEGEPGSNTPYAGPQSLEFSEIESLDQGGGTNLLDTELSGDAVPDEFRGKKVNDILGVIGNLRSALKLSEEARQTQAVAAQALTEARRASAPPPPPAPVTEEKEMTKEEWKALYESDPFEYSERRMAMIEKNLSKAVDVRVAPAAQTAVASAEQMARAKFKEDFELLGTEIDSFVNEAFPTAEARQVLTQPGAWDRVVKYVRGENLDKILAHREAKRGVATGTSRQQAEREAAPPAFSQRTPPTPQRSGRLTPASMDDTSKEIARNLMPDLPPQKAYEEYCKHYI